MLFSGFSTICNKKKWQELLLLPLSGVQDETRTHTNHCSLPPQSSASTNSATSPVCLFVYQYVSLEVFQEWKNLLRHESGKRDSNSRPQPWQGCALPTELFPRIFALQPLFPDCECKDRGFYFNHQTFLKLFSKKMHKRPH